MAAVVAVVVVVLTAAPSASARTDANGPVMTASPSLRPDRTSKYFSPAMPVFTGVNTALLFWTVNTPSSSLRVWPGSSSAAGAVTALGRRGRFSSCGGRTTLPLSSTISSRTVVAWIGTATTLSRTAVVISAVHVKPGRTSGISLSSVTTTLKLVACVDACPVPWIGLLPISVTLPVKVWPGIASIVTLAGCPNLTLGMSVSSTSTSAWMTDMSAIVSSTVPALFIVPMTTVSPSSMLRRVTMPVIGDSIRTLLRSNRAPAAVALSDSTRSTCVRRDCSCARRSASRSRRSLSERSSVSRVVSPPFQRFCWRV